jgi:hypothetical protein
MSDAKNGTNGTGLSIPAGMLPDLNAGLALIFPLQPPPPARGKYWIAKIAQAVATELPLYRQEKYELLRKHAPKDDKNEPMLRSTVLPNGQTRIDIDPVDRAAFTAEDASLGATPIVVPGVPQLTHADLGDCPIPQGVYTMMLGIIIKDEPPEGP